MSTLGKNLELSAENNIVSISSLILGCSMVLYWQLPVARPSLKDSTIKIPFTETYLYYTFKCTDSAQSGQAVDGQLTSDSCLPIMDQPYIVVPDFPLYPFNNKQDRLGLILPIFNRDFEMKIKKVEIKKGSVIYQEKPFVYALSSKMRTEHCDFCFEKTKLSKCSGCRYVYYCGKGCQKEGWPIHKFECKKLELVSPRVVPDAARLLARLIKILNNGGHQIKSYNTETSFRTYKDLMSHYPNLKNDQRRMEHFSSLCGVLFEYLGGDMLPNSAELMGMYGRMCINSFNICNQELQSLGTGIYLGASVIDHSCKPNALAMFEGTTLYIRSLETLPCLDWSKIFISYIDVLNSTKDRREELQNIYYFSCQCAKCMEPEPLDEMTGAACPNSKCDHYISINGEELPGKCTKCGAVITQEFINEFHRVIELSEVHINNMKHTTYYDASEICLQQQKGILFKHNLLHVKMVDLAFEGAISLEKFDNARILGLHLIDSYYRYYGFIHPLTGLLHLKLGKILLFQGSSREALDHLKKCNEIFKITHGNNSSIFLEDLRPLFQQAVLENCS